ncbi:hypothetical protein MMA55_23150, partial [Salmonella enterica]|nr:hypothetical protein [Salmonella enterica]
MSQPTSPTEAAPSAEEARLHAFVDDQLSPEERVAVLEPLAADPEAAARVAQWKEQRQAVRALARDWPLDETPA